MKEIDGVLPPCQNCGGPLKAVSGQHIAWTTTMTIGDAGIEDAEAHSGWCGQCIEDWNARMGATT